MDEGEKKVSKMARKIENSKKASLWTNLRGNTLAQEESC
jgi:hypothetical protein